MVLGLSPVPPRNQGAVVIRSDRPAYRVTDDKGFFADNDVLYPQGAMLYWEGPLNPYLEPLNDLAYDNMRAYLSDLDAKGKAAAEKAGTAYVSLSGSLDAARKLEELNNKGVEQIGAEKPVTLMGAKKSSTSFGGEVDVKEEAPIFTPKRRGRPPLNNENN